MKSPTPNSLAARRAKAEAPQPSQSNCIILTCALKSGDFQSSIEVPLYASIDEMRSFVSSWLAMMDAGIKIGLAKVRR